MYTNFSYCAWSQFVVHKGQPEFLKLAEVIRMELAHQNEAAVSQEKKTIVVKVNNRDVTFTEHKITGAVIKSTAIAQGVPIQQDFQLFEVKHGEPLKPIRDDQPVNLHEHQQFRATAPDDNS